VTSPALYGQGDEVTWTETTCNGDTLERCGCIVSVLSAQYLVECDDALIRFVFKNDSTLKEKKVERRPHKTFTTAQ
jgi:hypothetical protein